jgi:hypothetical protein
MDDATSELSVLLRWWEENPTANVGLNCEASGLVVLDVDPRHGGDDALFELERELGAVPTTAEALTGGGGQHILFRNPGGSFRREIAPGVDIKSAGYIVAPPSIHPSGRSYVWGEDPDEVGIADVPATWLARMTQVSRGAVPARNDETTDSLKWIPARVYAAVLTGRAIDGGGWMTCPFHKGGNERTPSFQVQEALWSCYACEPILGKRVLGGDIYELASLLWGYPLPLSGTDFLIVRSRLRETFS